MRNDADWCSAGQSVHESGHHARMPDVIIHAFAGVTGDIAMLESSRQRLVQCVQIVECTLSVAPRMAKRRYSDFLAIASSNTTMEATWNAPPTVLEMS